MTPKRTPEGKHVIYEVATGKQMERWPVDARPMLASGAYTAAPPTPGDDSPAAPVSPEAEQGASADAPAPLAPGLHSPGVPLVSIPVEVRTRSRRR